VLVVEPDGSLRQICEPSDGCDVIGNVRRQSWKEIRDSAGYRASVERDRQIRSRACNGCEYRSACDGYPVLSFNVTEAKRGECGVFKPLLGRIERELRAFGLSATDMRELLSEYVSAGP
jgi:radical SAM protein with 4Fe4S-binding SPASM domain